jgi:tricorn protease-like protein
MKRAAAVFVVALAVGLNAQRDDKKWDVSADLGPVTKLAFDTTEGTWMNVDVSPDGQQIVFDLLGDIYVMPVDGAANGAKRLTSGPVFDMQPRFSPDGKRIAISSDRDGLWNIWTMDLEGKDAKQISRERRWFVNSPAWSPDGATIYARRHFVKERSLGAGEIWAYHSAGASDGLQITDRNGWAEGCGRARHLARREVALLQQRHHPGTDVRIQQGSQRHHLRDHPARSDNGPRANRCLCTGWIRSAAGFA